MTEYVARLTASSFSSGGGYDSARNGVFIAHKFDDQEGGESSNFRRELGRELLAANAGIEVFDGRVPGGVDWAEEIRSRLRQSRVIVADVQGYKKEIMFEFGFASAFNKSLMPVRVEDGSSGDPPRWLTQLQYRRWPPDRVRIVNESAELALAKGGANAFRTGHCSAQKCMTINLDRSAKKIVDMQCSNMKITSADVLPDGSEPTMGKEAFRIATQSGTFVAQLRGDPADSYVHFLCGAMAAQPKVRGEDRLRRVMLMGPAVNQEALVSDAARRVDGLIRYVSDESRLLTALNRWSKP